MKFKGISNENASSAAKDRPTATLYRGIHKGVDQDTGAALESSRVDLMSFVIVSSETLERLGVLDKIDRMPLGTSYLNFKQAGSYHYHQSVSYRHNKTVPELGYARVQDQRTPLERIRQPEPSEVISPLYIEVEESLFVENVATGLSELRESSANALARLHAMLGDMVSQGVTTEVMAPEDDRFQLLEAKEFAARLDATDQTVYNWEKLGRLISVLAPGRVRSRRYPAFQLSPRLNRPLHEMAISMYRSHAQDMTLYWDFLRTRHKDFGGSTGVDFLLKRVAEPGLLDLEESDLNDLFLSMAEEDMSRANS